MWNSRRHYDDVARTPSLSLVVLESARDARSTDLPEADGFLRTPGWVLQLAPEQGRALTSDHVVEFADFGVIETAWRQRIVHRRIMQDVRAHAGATADSYHSCWPVASRWTHDGLEIGLWNKRESPRHVWRRRSSLSSGLSQSMDRDRQTHQNCKQDPDNVLLHRPSLCRHASAGAAYAVDA